MSTEESTRRYKTIVSHYPDSAFFWFDRAFRYTHCEGPAFEIVGLSAESIIGKTVSEVFPPEVSEVVIPAEKVLFNGQSSRYEVEYQGRVFTNDMVPVRDDDGAIVEGLVIARDVTEQRKNEENLRFQATILNQIADRITVTDMDGVITYVNDAVTRTTGWGRDDLIGRSVEQYGDDPERGYSQRGIIEETRTNGRWRGEVVNITPEGEHVLFDTRTQVVHDQKGNPLGMVGISTDITKRDEAARRLRESEARFRALFEHSLTGTFFVDPEGTIVEVNQQMVEMLGSPSAEATRSINVLTFQPLIDMGYAANFQRCLETGKPVFGENSYTSNWGKTIYVRYYFNPIHGDEGIIGVLASVDDISALQETTEKLRTKTRETEEMLREKEVLLRELYHRTKNNMQLIASLISLHRADIHTEATQHLLQELENKIYGMALIHEKLYRSNNLSRLDLGEYISDLLGLIRDSFRDRVGGLSLQTDLDEIDGLIDAAVPLGLVINELVANSIKHAFPKGRRGTISVSLKGREGIGCTLVICDDGVGLPKGLEPEKSDTIGLKTVFNIVNHQLDGTITQTADRGTRWEIHLGESQYIPRV